MPRGHEYTNVVAASLAAYCMESSALSESQGQGARIDEMLKLDCQVWVAQEVETYEA